jgi:hypothetical protein
VSAYTRRLLAAPLLGAVLAVLAVGAASVSMPKLVPKASAYVLSNGCDEYDPAQNVTYRCTPDRTAFYTPDGLDPNKVPIGSEYPGEGSVFVGVTVDGGGFTIPPPAPYRPGRDYCSNWLASSPFEGKWQFTCYRHDVCYGSQWGRKFCDARFWHNMIADCKNAYPWYTLERYGCFANATVWYLAVRLLGGAHYKPRLTSDEPKGE